MKDQKNVLSIRKLTISAMLLALGLVLPFLTGQIPRIGNMLLPMHIPVFLCGLICSWQYGAIVGFVLPLLRSALFGAPVMYPMAAAMALELMTYGLVSGIIYSASRRQGAGAIYRALIAAMLAGRIVWGAAETVMLGLGGSTFTWKAFMAGAFLNAIPGIAIQLILIPSIMYALDRIGLVKFRTPETKET